MARRVNMVMQIMNDQSRLTAQRRAGLPALKALLLGLMLAAPIAGCAARQLHTFRDRAADQDYGWIAAQAVTCDQSSDVCGQLHLIKGDACFRLAKADTALLDNYTCAAAELEKGLAFNRSWGEAAVQLQFQENLCESLRNLYDLQSGATAARNLERFIKAAEGLYQLAPDSVPAVYYLAHVRLQQVQPALFDLNAARRMPVCHRLKRSLTNVLTLMETAEQTPLPGWDRFAANYRRLSYELGSALHTAECR